MQRSVTSAVASQRLPVSLRITALAALLLGVMERPATAQITLAGFTFDANAGVDRVVPLPGSQPEFDGLLAGCSAGPTLPGLGIEDSLDAVLLSNTVDNWVRGRAVLRLDFEDNAIVNLPGADVMVFELGVVENFTLRVLDLETCVWSAENSYSQSATGFAVPCPSPNSINARAIDLDDFGVPAGATVRSLLLDNKGSVGSSTGADIMQVMAIHSVAAAAATPCLLSFQQGISGLAATPYAGVADTAYSSATPTTNLSASPFEYVDGSPYSAMLVRFDGIVGAAAEQIPAGATIRSATLHIATGGGSSNSSDTHAVHRLLQTWDAATITYASGFGGDGVDTDGVEAATVAESLVAPMGDNSAQGVDVTKAVQAWVLGAPNHGLLIQPGGSDGLGLHLSEAAIETRRPALTVVLETLSWIDLGGSLAGTNGAPHLQAVGVLAAGESIQLTLSNGVPNGTVIFVLGTGVLNAPFYGGTFVPTPDVVLAGIPLDGAGGLSVPGVWPSGVPAGHDIVIQFWMQDPGGPLGFAATNARKAVTH
jgi:hypothetical protein